MRAESAPKLSDGAVCSRFLADARCSLCRRLRKRSRQRSGRAEVVQSSGVCCAFHTLASRRKQAPACLGRLMAS